MCSAIRVGKISISLVFIDHIFEAGSRGASKEFKIVLHRPYCLMFAGTKS